MQYMQSVAAYKGAQLSSRTQGRFLWNDQICTTYQLVTKINYLRYKYIIIYEGFLNGKISKLKSAITISVLATICFDVGFLRYFNIVYMYKFPSLMTKHRNGFF